MATKNPLNRVLEQVKKDFAGRLPIAVDAVAHRYAVHSRLPDNAESIPPDIIERAHAFIHELQKMYDPASDSRCIPPELYRDAGSKITCVLFDLICAYTILGVITAETEARHADKLAALPPEEETNG